jgi:hypothetical protein
MGMLQPISQSDQDALIERIRQYMISQQNPQQNQYLQNSYAQNTGVTDTSGYDDLKLLDTESTSRYQQAVNSGLIPKTVTKDQFEREPQFQSARDIARAKVLTERNNAAYKASKAAESARMSKEIPVTYDTESPIPNGMDILFKNR